MEGCDAQRTQSLLLPPLLPTSQPHGPRHWSPLPPPKASVPLPHLTQRAHSLLAPPTLEQESAKSPEAPDRLTAFPLPPPSQP